MRKAAESKANDIVREIIMPGMNDYEKVLAVHDYVIKNSRYDRLNADNGTVPAEEHEAYGVLVNGVGVCDSYAKAVKLILDKSGVQCMLVEGSKAENAGQGLNDVDHAWNIVRVDGEYYHVDATWDDVSEEWDSSEVGYQHLNLNDEEMQKTHIWDRSKYPQCTSTKYNYFRYSKLFAENHTETLSMLHNAISHREKKLIFRISDYDSTAYDIEKMIIEAAEKSSLKNGIKARWAINETFGVLDIEFEY
jgi:transglutaminase/protease-like cytokinesis protein 3